MKSNKVLLGLFTGVLALIGGSLTAQTTFREIGPANVAGHVSSLVVDQRDTNHTTVYAGAIAGGLYMRSSDDALLTQLYTNSGRDVSLAENHNMWHQVPCNDVLPITSMVQGPDNTIYIGTGDNTFHVGNAYGRMSVLGKGIFRFNPDEGTFTLVPNTVPTGVTHRFAAVKHVACLERNGKLYFYAVTGTGIYRWVINSESDWNNTPTEVFSGEVGDFLMVRSRRVAYFSVGNQLYKIGDVTATSVNTVNISASNSDFAGETDGIKLASTEVNPEYLYAMTMKEGYMRTLYVTTNEQTWITLTTETVVPFYGDGATCGTMTVDPANPKRVYIAGSTIWAGEGHVEGSYYQWTKSSYCEDELNYGDYMATVFTSAQFVHSGIHQIVPCWQDGEMVYYIATDGGVFTTNAFNYYENTNMGLNTIQINDLAVCPDGTVISGAVSNASIMVDGRLNHNAVETEPSWFDADNSGMNHSANVIFSNNGGKVAASMFQQVKPASRRLVMVSNDKGNYGRAFADYLDYTNTQTWTQGSDFISGDYYYPGPNNLGIIHLWETKNDHLFNDSLHYVIDTLGFVLRKRNGVYDSVWFSIDGMTTGAVFERDEAGRIIDTIAVGTGHGSKFQIVAGDKMMVHSRANSDYPFEYTFTKGQKAGDPLVVKNPLQARVLVAARQSDKPDRWTVQISLRGTDFTKVWDETVAAANNPQEDACDFGTLCLWYPLHEIFTNYTAEENLRPRDLTMSSDGNAAFIAVQDIKNNRSMIVRIRDFDKVNYYLRDDSPQTRSEDYSRLYTEISATRGNSLTKLSKDTLEFNGSKWIPRLVSSIRTDTIGSGAERMLVTFEDYSTDFASFAIVENCLADNWSMTQHSITGHAGVPAFCSMVERTTGDIYVGTADGVFFRHGTLWSPYAELQGIPVTSMQQQQNDLPTVHALNHNGINPVKYAFAKTKWPNAMYFGTYGRGIFIDMKYVTDTTNEVVDSIDNVGIPTVHTTMGSVSVYPNPVYGEAHLSVVSDVAANGSLRIYDLNGRCVAERQLGRIAEGENNFTISTEGFAKGMYLVNVIIGGYTSATKMMVR